MRNFAMSWKIHINKCRSSPCLLVPVFAPIEVLSVVYCWIYESTEAIYCCCIVIRQSNFCHSCCDLQFIFCSSCCNLGTNCSQMQLHVQPSLYMGLGSRGRNKENKSKIRMALSIIQGLLKKEVGGQVNLPTLFHPSTWVHYMGPTTDLGWLKEPSLFYTVTLSHRRVTRIGPLGPQEHPPPLGTHQQASQ